MSTQGFDDVFSRLIEQVNTAATATPTNEEPAQGPEVQGKAYDDRITVTMRSGRVTSVELQPHALKLDNVTLGEELTKAFNAALDANLAAVMDPEQGGIDYGALNKELQVIQAESLRQLNRYTDAMSDMLRGVKQSYEQ